MTDENALATLIAANMAASPTDADYVAHAIVAAGWTRLHLAQPSDQAVASAFEALELEIRDAKTLDVTTKAAICAVIKGKARRLRAALAQPTDEAVGVRQLLDDARRIDRIGQTSSGELSDSEREFWISHPLAYLGDFPRPIERVVEWLEQVLAQSSGRGADHASEVRVALARSIQSFDLEGWIEHADLEVKVRRLAEMVIADEGQGR